MRPSSAFAAVCLAGAAVAAPHEDAVPTLPLYGAPPTPMYSGYLDGKGTPEVPGCAATEAECKMHYWFAGAEGPDAAKKPVVLWLNGGPGSSSVLGMLQEWGPLVVNDTGGLMVNPWSWCKVANVFIIESPTGVGYSYCSTQKAGGVCKNTDKLTASTARAAVMDFFTTKFPELADNEFFIAGESYAGVYVPTLAKELLDHAKGVVNLKGLSVGDPCTDNTAQKDSMDMLWYAHKYGFVPEQDFDLLWNKCNLRVAHPLTKSTVAWGAGQAAKSFTAMKEQFHAEHSLDAQRRKHEAQGTPLTTECQIAYRKYMAGSSKGFSQGWKYAYINNLMLYGAAAVVSFDDPGSMNWNIAQYMMRPDVLKALHVDSAPSKTWPSPEQGFDYKKQYAACNYDAAPGTPSMVDFYREIAPQLDVTLVMNGDVDPCVSYEGTRTAISRVGFAELDGGAYRPWFFNHTAAPLEVLKAKSYTWGPSLSLTAEGVQMGGSVVNYAHGLHFQTVHGAGHMVPQFRAQASLQQLTKVVTKMPFTPLMPGNATLGNMTDDQFDAALDKWVLSAKAHPYVL
eukprot:TRINITY_DN2037_c1_g3_i1.p1 TRINITY_DN2037_c1_g3~~TRINITY_DN2037_c1_g3_i1.p1  ORF type:complete len:566 (+),score=224.34 TRINITY_DN2037_c1_g3_i1:57-1754(+)